jgi:regulator of ribonuclease activity A
MDFATTDLSDAYPEAGAAGPGLSDFGGVRRFCGPIRTVRCREDNSLVRTALEEPGDGAVLVVDGGGSLSCALLGDRLTAAAIANGWSGVIVNGCVRDRAELAGMGLGIRALAAHPRRSEKRNTGERDVTVTFLGVDFTPGAWVYVDEDGLLVLPSRIDG